MNQKNEKDVLTRAYFEIEDLEVRVDGDKRTIAGYAAMFEKLSLPIYNFKEKIRAGAFRSSLAASKDIKALWNHNPDIVLGSTKAGTLRLLEDDKGLRFELDPPDTQAGRDALVSIGRKDVSGVSFGFRTLKQEWDESDKNNIVRTLVDVDLREISPTPFPAYPATKVNVRTVEDEYKEHSDSQAEVNAEKDKQEADLKILQMKTRLAEIAV